MHILVAKSPDSGSGATAPSPAPTAAMVRLGVKNDSPSHVSFLVSFELAEACDSYMTCDETFGGDSEAISINAT